MIGTTVANYCNSTCNTIPDMEANSDQYACTPCELSALAAATDVVNKVLDPPKSTQLPAKLPGMVHWVLAGVGCTCKTARGNLISGARNLTTEKLATIPWLPMFAQCPSLRFCMKPGRWAPRPCTKIASCPLHTDRTLTDGLSGRG